MNSKEKELADRRNALVELSDVQRHIVFHHVVEVKNSLSWIQSTYSAFRQARDAAIGATQGLTSSSLFSFLPVKWLAWGQRLTTVWSLLKSIKKFWG